MQNRRIVLASRPEGAACPKGIDVYFENVGGQVLRAVLPLLNDHARVPLCGVIATYNSSNPDVAGVSADQLLRACLIHRVKLQGFLVSDAFARMGEFRREMNPWLAAGEVRYAEHVTKGLENAPAAFLGMLEGANLGKAIVELA